MEEQQVIILNFTLYKKIQRKCAQGFYPYKTLIHHKILKHDGAVMSQDLLYTIKYSILVLDLIWEIEKKLSYKGAFKFYISPVLHKLMLLTPHGWWGFPELM